MQSEVMVKILDDLSTDIIMSPQMTPVVPPEDTRTPAEVLLQRLAEQLLVPNQALELTDEQVITFVSELQYAYYLIGRVLVAVTSYNPIYDPSEDSEYSLGGLPPEQAFEQERAALEPRED